MTAPDQVAPMVVSARLEHIAGVTRLHEEFIADQTGQEALAAGAEFLRAYYGDLIARDDCALLVAVVGNHVVGYVSLVAGQSRVLLGLLRHHPGLLGRTALRLAFWRQIIRYVLAKASLELLGRKWDQVGSVDGLEVCRRAVELRSVAVDPTWRGHAVGIALVEAAQARALASGWVPLIAWVAELNAASNRLFQRAGFRLMTTRGEPPETVNLYAWDRSPASGAAVD